MEAVGVAAYMDGTHGEYSARKTNQNKNQMNPNIIKLIMAVVTTIGTALQASRNDHAKVAEIKSEADKQIDAIEASLKEKEEAASSEDLKQIGELRSHLENTVTTALAARPPTPEQIQEVEGIPPTASTTGDKPPAENVVTHRPE